ncbi:MAG: TolC family outer membrane protein [Marinicaulis sp.]|nr:TolC family outer membrane protein [Marinicaulis sp.]
MRRLACAVLALSSIANTGNAQELHEVLTLVYETNPTIRAERNRQRATEELKDQALSQSLPQIVGNAGLGRSTNTQTTTAGLFTGGDPTTRQFKLENTNLGVSAEQTVFSGFRNYHSYKQAKSRIKAGNAQLAGVEQQTLLNAVAAYFDVTRDLEVFNANNSNVAVLAKQLDDANVRFELGDVTKTDVLQAEARLSGAKAQLSAAKTQLADSRMRFREVVGAPPETLNAARPLPGLPETLDEAQAVAREMAPQYLVVQSEADASRRQIKVEQGARLPTVSLTASYARADEPSSFIIDDEQWSYGIRATIPIFRGGLEFSRLREAKALHARDRARIVATERNIEVQISFLWEQLQEARARIESSSAQAMANEQALKGVRREAQLGARTTLDVLNAEQEFLNAQVAQAAAVRNQQVAAYGLLAAMGVLSPDAASLANLQNAVFDADSYMSSQDPIIDEIYPALTIEAPAD